MVIGPGLGCQLPEKDWSLARGLSHVSAKKPLPGFFIFICFYVFATARPRQSSARRLGSTESRFGLVDLICYLPSASATAWWSCRHLAASGDVIALCPTFSPSPRIPNPTGSKGRSFIVSWKGTRRNSTLMRGYCMVSPLRETPPRARQN